MAASKDGVFASTEAGLFRLADGRWERAWPADEVASAPLLDMVAVSGDEAWGLWVGAWGNGVNEIWHFRDGVASRESGTEGVPSGVRDLALAPDGTLWAATDHGVATRVGGTWTIVDEQPAVASPSPRTARCGSAARDRKRGPCGGPAPDGTSAACRTQRRLPRRRRGSPRGRSARRWLSTGPAASWASGGNQGWFDTPGLLRFGGERWEEMRPVAEAGTTVFGNVVAAPDGAVWVTIDTTSANGTAALRPTPRRRSPGSRAGAGTCSGRRRPAGRQRRLQPRGGPDGAVWLSTTQGLCSFDGERWTVHFKGHYFGTVAAAPDGTLWASGEGGVVRIAPGAADAEPTGG